MTPRQIAIQGGQKTYTTGKPCRQGHAVPRRVVNNQCVECARLNSLAYRAKNPTKASQDSKRWREQNPEATGVHNAAYYAANVVSQRARAAAYRAENPEKVKGWEKSRNKQVKLESNRAWRKANPEKPQGYNRRQYQNDPGPFKQSAARRRTRLAKASLKLSSEHEKQMARLYSQCPEGFHVDHIVPLRNPRVSGLHVPWNLQYLSANDNMSKGNKLPPPDQLIARIAA